MRQRVVLLIVCLLGLSVVGGVARAEYPLREGGLDVGAPGSDDRTPSTVEPGEPVTLAGGGFAPGSSIEIWMYSTPVLLATVSAGAAGSFDAAVKIPADAPAGAHTLKAIGKAPGGGRLVLSRGITVGSVTEAGESGTGRSAADADRGSGGGLDAVAEIAGQDLPFTGAPLGLVAAIGAGLVGLGAALRRRSERT